MGALKWSKVCYIVREEEEERGGRRGGEKSSDVGN